MEKTKRNNLIIIIFAIFLAVALVSTFIGSVYWFFSTYPKIEDDLKYSPFRVEGVWKSEEYDFTITSYSIDDSEYIDEVVGVFVKDNNEYNLNFHYLSNRGFSHKYAVTIYIDNEDYSVGYSCKYQFKENEFVLKSFSSYRDEKIFKGINEIKFIKQ